MADHRRGGQDRPVRVRGARAVLRRRDRPDCSRSSTRSCSGATRGSACRSWAPRSRSRRSSARAPVSRWASGSRSASAPESEPAVAAFCVSEPDAGSDVSSLRTRAVYDEAKDEWVLNGQKAWATNGGIAGVHVVVASVDRDLGSRGQAAFVIPPGTQGPRHGREGQEARPARLAHRRRLPRRLPRPRLVPARRQGEARRAPRARARGRRVAPPGGDADVRGHAARRSARRRSASPAPPTSTRSSTRRSASSSAARSSRTRRSRSRSPT